MFSSHLRCGYNFPTKTISLTFDDGPQISEMGSQTLSIAKYLFDEKIKATFFVLGKCAIKYPKVLNALIKYGHCIGNHTFNHFNLTTVDQNVAVKEIFSTDILIRRFKSTILFRPPFGAWSSNLADYANKNFINSRNYRGPIGWDIDAQDWLLWKRKITEEACAEEYFERIIRIKRGIVLMHDSNPFSLVEEYKTFKMLQILVPRLKKIGFKFINLDEIFI